MTQTAHLIIAPDATLHQAIAAIDRGARQIALVVDGAGRLVATVTDGDVRRGLLRGLGLDAPVAEVMNRTPLTIRAEEGPEAARRLMRARSLHHVPVVDDAGRLVDLAWIDDLSGLARRDTRVVLMAGGLGQRLRPLTETVPKPMLPVGGRPILEHILRSFVDQGFVRFTISLNYLGEKVRAHFGDGAEFGAEIDYVEEQARLGTAGALSLLTDRPASPFIVMNGDLLTQMRFDALLRFHDETGAAATLCARPFEMQVPYGVIEADGPYLRGIVEKPVHSHFVNAGIYALSPGALDALRPGEPLDMPDLFTRLTDGGAKAGVFPLREYWLDIGRLEDLERARAEFDDGAQR